MEKYSMKSLATNNSSKGFSLIEVVVALFILSISVITIYNLIISTASSSFELEQRYLAKQVADNRVALINTSEKPSKPIKRSGEIVMGGVNWYWVEEIKAGLDKNYYEYEILVRLVDKDNYIYSTQGFLNNE
ncbi:MAG: type II secretion system protein GspI [Flavobacteriaceae bacterium]|nr:type II secretion system protein GspI [Flavobacteriaceae bacterium]|tara:strand:- start:3997 stop:4392 length:396 start_codon:yes stop_codon:yes gene_type:complete